MAERCQNQKEIPVILVNQYGIDAVRYFLLREVPFGSDGAFSNEALINRINSDLANDLGNLVSRTVAMIEKYFDGVIPENRLAGDYDKDLKETVKQTVIKVEDLLDRLQLDDALTYIWKTISRINKYIDETTPWILGRNAQEKPRLAEVLFNLAESIRIISILIRPFMPKTPEIIWQQFGLTGDDFTSWESAHIWGKYNTKTGVKRGNVLFPRIDVNK